MGLSHSDIQNEDLFKEFRRDEWSRELDRGLYELWKNSKTGELCEAYKLNYIPQEQELQHYRFRHYNQNADNFVEICYVDVEKMQSLCSQGQSYVLTEFIPIKLSEMRGLTNVEAYSILRAAYRAFHTMEAFHGPFVPDEDLIGINLNGRAKIWLNRNHSKNKADKAITAQIWQKHMGQVSENVRRIVEMVEQRIIGKRFPSQFREYFYENVLSFSQASQFVQQYCEKYRIIIPDTVEYLRHLKDAEIIKIVNQYNAKNNPAPLSNNLDTLAAVRQNFQFTQPNRENGGNVLRRNVSHQNFTYHHSQVLPSQAYNARSTLGGANLQRPIISPAPQGSAFFQIVVPKTTLRPTYLNQQNIGTLNAKPVMVIQPNVKMINGVNGVSYQSPVQGGRMVNYQSMQTPQHVANQMAFMHPRRIAEFQQPVRDISQVERVRVDTESQLPVRIETSEVKPVEEGVQQRTLNRQYSIHEKIRGFQNEDIQRYNRINFNHNQQNYQPQVSVPTQQEQQFHGYINNDSHYQNSQQQVDNHTSEPDWENIEHQKQIIQHNYETQQENKQNNEGQSYQFKKPTQHRKQPSDISPIKQNQHRNIEEFQNHIAMLSHYADPKRNYNQGSQDNNKDVADSFEPRLNQSNEYEPQRYQSLEQSYPNQAPQQEDNTPVQEDFTPVQEDFSVVQEEKDEQYLRHQQGHQLQSSQRIRQLSSKNTSINRGMHGESSGTLVIHQSRENLYLGVNQDKLDKIVVTNIQQESQQSQNDQHQNQDNYQKQYYDERERQYIDEREKERQYYDEGEGERQYIDERERQQIDEGERQYIDEGEGQYIDKNENEQYDGSQMRHEEQREGQHEQTSMYGIKQHNNELLEFRSGKSQDQSQQQQDTPHYNLQLQDRNNNTQQPQQQEGPLSQRSINKSQELNSQQQQHNYQEQSLKQSQEEPQSQPQDIIRQYDNLHFRNESEELYQYTPVESVIRNDSEQHYHYGALPRPQYSSGIQELVQIEKHQDIENYIRNKYSDVIYSDSQPQNQPFHRKGSSKQGNRAMTFAKLSIQENQSEKDRNQEEQTQQRPKQKERLYKRIQDKYSSPIQRGSSAKHSNEENDYLDVGNLQKSLDQKYNNQPQPKQSYMQSPQISHNIRRSQTMSQQDGMNVAALQQRLQKFEQRQSIQRQKSQRKLQSYNEDSSSRNNNELNFHELDNIVELMDRKIQQSQKKQRQSYQQIKDRSVTEFSRKQNTLQNVELQTSIINLNNQELSLKDIPVLGKDRGSNVNSSSIPPSRRDRVNYYGFDSEDFATARGQKSYQFNSKANNQIYTTNNKRQTQKYQQKYDNISPPAQIERKYQTYTNKNYQNTYTNKNYQNAYTSKNYQNAYTSKNYQNAYSSKNYQNEYSPKENLIPSKNYDKIGSYVPTTVNDDSYRQTNDYSRKSSRRSTKNNEDAKRIADKIASKYDKYINGGTSNSQNEKPFTKKSYYDSGVSYESSKNITSAYQTYNSKYTTKQATGSYQPSLRNIQRKLSSYLNPIQELNGQNNVSPYKEQIGSKRNQKVLVGNPLQKNRQNFSRPSNQSSRVGSKNSLPDNKPGKNSRVSYDELRDLLWK